MTFEIYRQCFVRALVFWSVLLSIIPHHPPQFGTAIHPKIHFPSLPNYCPAICCVLEWSLNKTHSERSDMAHKKGREKHVINHKSLRPGRQRRHRSIHLLHFHYLPPLLAASSCSFHTASLLPGLHPSLHYSLTLSMYSLIPISFYGSECFCWCLCWVWRLVRLYHHKRTFRPATLCGDVRRKKKKKNLMI